MSNNNEIVGTNFDWNLFGYEIDLLEMVIEIHDELLKKGKTLKLTKYPSMKAFREKTEGVLNG